VDRFWKTALLRHLWCRLSLKRFIWSTRPPRVRRFPAIWLESGNPEFICHNPVDCTVERFGQREDIMVNALLRLAARNRPRYYHRSCFGRMKMLPFITPIAPICGNRCVAV